VLLFGAWIACELRAAHPMLDPRLFRIPLLRGAALGTMVIFFAMFALFYVNASYLQYSKDYGVLRTGFAVLPLAVIMIVVARFASSLSGWIGRQGTDALAFGLVGVGLLLLSNCGTSTSYLVYASYLLVVGAGLALALPGLTADITSSLPPEQAGVSSGLQSTTRELGSALGVAVVGTVMTARFIAGLPAGLENGAGVIPHTIADALSLAHTTQLRIALVQDFTHSVDIGLRVMGIVTLLAGLLVLAQLRQARAHCVGTAAGLRG
jgi:predicted MFS family arabinose efflux permease